MRRHDCQRVNNTVTINVNSSSKSGEKLDTKWIGHMTIPSIRETSDVKFQQSVTIELYTIYVYLHRWEHLTRVIFGDSPPTSSIVHKFEIQSASGRESSRTSSHFLPRRGFKANKHTNALTFFFP